LDLNADYSFIFFMNGPKCPYASKNDVNDFIKKQKTSSSPIHRWQGKICLSSTCCKEDNDVDGGKTNLSTQSIT
jgi:hypothetical protein